MAATLSAGRCRVPFRTVTAGRVPSLIAAVAIAAGLIACGGGGPAGATTETGGPVVTAKAGGDWTRFGFNAARYNRAPRGPSAADVAKLSPRSVSLPGTVDSSPIYLSGVSAGGQSRSTVVMTT